MKKKSQNLLTMGFVWEPHRSPSHVKGDGWWQLASSWTLGTSSKPAIELEGAMKLPKVYYNPLLLMLVSIPFFPCFTDYWRINRYHHLRHRTLKLVNTHYNRKQVIFILHLKILSVALLCTDFKCMEQLYLNSGLIRILLVTDWSVSIIRLV